VLDYAMGNLRSVAKAIEVAGARVVVTDRRKDLDRCDVLVLPGQGAFGTAVRVLREKRLDGFVRGWLKEGRPYLGICLGLQLLFDSSEEAPGCRGLGVIPGRVRRFRPGRGVGKIPHMGWNEASPRAGNVSGRRLLARPAHFYFVHSYYADPDDRSAVWLETEYGRRFCSAVAGPRLVATQFHPEKSGDNGLSFLRAALRRLAA
jgi:imidazole glycerol phosphate synthase glutamine amidotransferase subunit